jgi:aspartyl-tRNA(Asn)/glutamyl-tRNA(Gln) amidotransferase subunit A
MTRTVRDNALMLQVIAGHDPGDPGSADESVPDYGAMLSQGVSGLRIGVIRHFYTKDIAGDPEQVTALDAPSTCSQKRVRRPVTSPSQPCRTSALAARSSSLRRPMPCTSNGSRSGRRIMEHGLASGSSPGRRCAP